MTDPIVAVPRAFSGAVRLPSMCALDIETDTTGGGGLDPTRSRVVAVAVAFDDADPVVVDSSDEAELLVAVDALLGARSGLLVTWNGAGFDLPFLAVRGELLGVDWSLQTCEDASIPVKYTGPAGLGGPRRGRWGVLDHVDVAPLWRPYAEIHGIHWSLKPVAQAEGLRPVTVDREAIHRLSPAELAAYVASDAVVTLTLAARLGGRVLADAASVERSVFAGGR